MPGIKTTYTLDDESARALATLAQRWNVAEPEALRRALLQAASQYDPIPSPGERLAALDLLQKSLAERGVDFDAWAREAWAIRHGADPE
ncbi:MAG: hypothetical protein OXL37_18025 [Chloroflexota bacterium]|nr:hypothetical protein [Chloroflexota bacterium]MDE2958869.1 hypothetical protein [Chloroflexota bacterium]